MYNLLFGVNPLSNIILELLELKQENIERFRDCGIEEDKIWIYTRTGGNNKQYYPNKILTSHENYLNEIDDSFDSTYAMYEFSIPVNKKENVNIIKELIETANFTWKKPDWVKKFKELEMNIEEL